MKRKQCLLPWEFEDGTVVDLADKNVKPFTGAVWEEALGRWFGPPDLDYFKRSEAEEENRVKREKEALESSRRAFNETVRRCLNKFAGKVPIELSSNDE